MIDFFIPVKTVSEADVLWADYLREKSVHRVATIHGVTGETVRVRLLKAGHKLKRHSGNLQSTDWTAAQIARLREWYSSKSNSGQFNLDSLAADMGRLKSNISRKARSLGLTNIRRKKVDQRKPPKPRKFEDDSARRRAVGVRIAAYIKENGHPKGMKGLKHKAEVLAVLSEKSREMWRDPTSTVNSEVQKQRRSDQMLARNQILKQEISNPYSRAARGRRADLNNRFFRSSWEANYARFLNFLMAQGQIAGWEYEAQTFYFDAIKRGVRSYTPDFKVIDYNGEHEWHEVKGWMDDKSRVRLKRMARYYPSEKVIVIDRTWFSSAKRQGLNRMIAHWEKG